MPDPQLPRLQAVLGGLAAGSAPAGLLRDVLEGVLAASAAPDALLVRATAAGPAVLATTGHPPALLATVAAEAMASGRLARRRDPATDAVLSAEPMRAGGTVIGALAIAGPSLGVDATHLGLWASTAALILAQQGPALDSGAAEVVEAVAGIGADPVPSAVLAAGLHVYRRLLGSRGGLIALTDGSGTRIAHYEGLEQERVLAASRMPELRDLIGTERLEIAPAAHPAVARLARLGEVAACVPMVVGSERVGTLVLLLGRAPDPAQRALLEALARLVAASLRSAQLVERLADHEDQLTAMVHSLAHPIVVVDEGGRLTEANGAASEVFRLASNFELGQPVAGRLGHEGLEQALQGGSDQSVEVVLGADARRVYRATIRRIRSSAGKAMGRILILDDLTTAREVDALKSDFVAVIGHELRTPIMVMKGFVHSLTRRWETMPPEKRQEALDGIQSNVFRLERLVEDTLFLSSIEQKRVKLELALQDVGALLELHATDRVEVRRPRRPVEVEVDERRLGQVVHHLLDNALKFSDGPVVLEVDARDGEIEISVSDSGPGIFSGDIPQLFERFRQLDGTTTRAHGGVGIGLYLCRRIVEALGGRIWCDSRLGVGSRFAFTLPVERAAPAAPPAEPALGAAHAPVHQS